MTKRSTFTMFYYYDHMSKTTEISRQVTCKGRQERLPYRSKVKQPVNTSLHLICLTKDQEPRTNPIEIAILLRFLLIRLWIKTRRQEYAANESRSIQLHNCCHCNHLTTAHLRKNSGYVTVPREELTYYAQINSTANYVTDKKATTSDRADELIKQEEYSLPERFPSKRGEKPYIWVCLPVSRALYRNTFIIFYAVWHVLIQI